MSQVTTKTLYFVEDGNASAADVTRAAKIPGIVVFRNANQAHDEVETCDQVTCSIDSAIPSAYVAKPRVSPERPLSITIVPDNWTIDLSDVEHGDLRAIAKWMDGTVTDVTTSCAWSSSDEAKATVGAATGIVTPIGAGACVITASYPVAAQGETGNVLASILATFSTDIPSANDVFVIGDITYTWKVAPADTSSATAVQVKIADTWEECRVNFMAAINGAAGRGTRYSSDAVKNAKARAVAGPEDDEVTIVARVVGTAPNAYATTETGSAVGFADTSLNLGANATTPVTDTTPLTVAA